MDDDQAPTPYAAGPAATALVELDADVLSALDAWIAIEPVPRPSRDRAITLALRDWLTGLDLLSLQPDTGEPHQCCAGSWRAGVVIQLLSESTLPC